MINTDRVKHPPAATAHPFAPICDERSRLLILGSFPSVRSREAGFYYAHPQNRFWRVLAAVLRQPLPQEINEKRAMLLSAGIALWDVVAACEITGSADSALRSPQPNDLRPLFAAADIRRVFANGQTAGRLYARLSEPATGLPAVTLPSTSPANAAWSLERLIEAWRCIL